MNGCSSLIVAVAIVLTWAWFALGYHIVRPPTQDQLYGCTAENQAPNGECK